MNQDLIALIVELTQRKRMLSPPISPHSNLRRDLNFDSLDLAVLGIRVQEEFNVDIFELPPFQTLGELDDRLKEVQNRKS